MVAISLFLTVQERPSISTDGRVFEDGSGLVVGAGGRRGPGFQQLYPVEHTFHATSPSTAKQDSCW